MRTPSDGWVPSGGRSGSSLQAQVVGHQIRLIIHASRTSASNTCVGSEGRNMRVRVLAARLALALTTLAGFVDPMFPMAPPRRAAHRAGAKCD